MTGVLKRVLRPERVRQVPPQFSWVDHALVQCGLIDRCDARSAALYLFLVTVADAQGLSLSGILCARHSMMTTRSMYAKQEDDEGGAASAGEIPRDPEGAG